MIGVPGSSCEDVTTPAGLPTDWFDELLMSSKAQISGIASQISGTHIGLVVSWSFSCELSSGSFIFEGQGRKELRDEPVSKLGVSI